jgi:hypothetical protein
VSGLLPGGPSAGLVEVEIIGSNRLGNHVTGTVRLQLPAGDR